MKLAEDSPVLGAGADPTKLIEDLAKRSKVKTLGVSMGQGQEVIARKLLAQATVEGQWVLLQNTHLGLGFLSEVHILCCLSSYRPMLHGRRQIFHLWL